ncbi:TIGR03620 family F420-dependent LLM class oxidoreductase [Pseudonocardia sp. TRM90224]|uniref:TIGR03620 family F420-dependent LLM class oxidoreductase n=1 Tax=Pseudonocardia sp. TRM90224 TaxID=2812678 RepID=UPI001E5CC2A9|nr:TIGR03620 family F420-dependent LLM class oxidoreductase [Pseudonocardia sp. TRM90224]
MTIEALGRYGVALTVDDELEASAAAVERQGYSAIWVAGGQLESLEPLLRILRATTRVAVVPGIIPLDVHDPVAIAELYAEAERIAPGRLVVGLGGPQRVLVGGLAALEKAVDELDAAGVAPRERRLLAAMGPRKLDLAGDRFGGAVTLLVNPEFTAWARKRLGDGPTLVADQMVTVVADPQAARSAAREILGFLSQVRGYAAAFSRMGFSDAEIAEVSDGLVDAAVAWGGIDQVVARLREQVAAGADHVVVAPLGVEGGPSEVETTGLLAAHLLG